MNPTQAQLEDALEHVRYESDMLGRTVIELVKSAEQALYPEPVNWALLESYLLHTRSLIDFVTNRTRDKKHDRDILISDYEIDGWPIPDGSLRQELFKHKDEVSARVAHLTFLRVEHDPQWDFRAGSTLLDLMADWAGGFTDHSPFAAEIAKLVDGLEISGPTLKEAQARLARAGLTQQ